MASVARMCCCGDGFAKWFSLPAADSPPFCQTVLELASALERLEAQVSSNEKQGIASPQNPESLKAKRASAAALETLGCLNCPASPDDGLDSLSDALGLILQEATLAAALAASHWNFSLDDAFKRASEKVRGRTPYMPAWGDGSAAQSLEQAQAHWKAAKAREKAGHGVDQISWKNTPCQRKLSGKLLLVWVVHELTSTGRCPWTDTMQAAELLKYFQEECTEAEEEMRILRDGAARKQSDLKPAALLSELGDIFFSFLMALFIIRRDFQLEPARIIERLTH
eukprot:TRINITY_DN72993_c0_g1_i1.p1 TRINITY_DN72993_c0_g1~~TRINITY_DN72993_c0_g1_i1.p1  ORF type:complete len:293 (+),score=67.39 TRINITY_DN72993_c0_g1_i1:36-881(+)